MAELPQAYGQMRTLTIEDLQAVPKGALVKYQCRMDDVVWYEPLEQVLAGSPLEPEDPSESHWCPYCDDPVSPTGYLIFEKRKG